MGAPSHMGLEILSRGYLKFHLFHLCPTTPSLPLLHAWLAIFSLLRPLSLVLFAVPDLLIYALFGSWGTNSGRLQWAAIALQLLHTPQCIPWWVFVTRRINAPTIYPVTAHCITLHHSVLANMCQQHRHLVSQSHMFQVSSLCSSYKYRSQPSMRTTSNWCQLKDIAQSQWIPKWLFASGLANSN